MLGGVDVYGRCREVKYHATTLSRVSLGEVVGKLALSMTLVVSGSSEIATEKDVPLVLVN